MGNSEKAIKEISQEKLKSLLSYDSATGLFTRICGPRTGSIIRSLDKQGYVRIKIDRYPWLAHRLAWLYMYGYFPSEIDHINGICDDNRIENLRKCTRSQNRCNTGATKTNKSGLKGVQYRPRLNLWAAQIKIKGKNTGLGHFKSADLANAAYEAKARELHGEFYYGLRNG